MTIRLLAAALAVTFGTTANAALWTLSGNMDPLQAGTNGGFGAGTGNGNGTIAGTYDDVTNEINYEIVWADLTSPTTVSHFHLGAPGSSGGVTLGFTPTSPSIGNATLTEAQETDLLAGNWYVNIHTTNYPGGEIRGQVNAVIPEPGSLALLGLGGLLVARRRRRA
ncbi:MAG: CHRD domain-containing protein [Phycisphaeraceae bacterium]